MKKSLLLLSFTLMTVTNGIAQTTDTKETKDAPIETSSPNKWVIEVNAGKSKGLKPYSSTKYFSSNPDAYLGNFDFNSFDIGLRYMFSPKFGLKLDIARDLFENIKGTDSYDFKTEQYRIGVQGVVNAARLFDIQNQLGAFSFLLHGGVSFAQATPKLEFNQEGRNPIYNHTEDNIGIILGVTPEVRITKKIALMVDLSLTNNFRQHFAWDGHYAPASENLTGQMASLTLGASYSFGDDKMHADWAIIETKDVAALAALDKKIGDLETMLNDSDKDGVPDYLDVENNSIAGVAVDTKGRMVDINKNGVPDELEKYMDNTYADKASLAAATKGADGVSSDGVKKLINEGYVTTYFETGKTKPTNVSTEGIDFILTYLRNNPGVSVDVIGHADEVGNSKANDKLAIERATSVKNTLVKAGIDAKRLNVKSGGEDSSVDPKSPEARRLVRRVTFKVVQ
jgi:OOP family OmpA-OmpF porin